MKWLVAVIIPLIITAALVSAFLAFDSAISGAVGVWAESEAMLSVPQRILVSVWMLVRRFSLIIGVLIFPLSLAVSLIIAARKK